MEESITMMADLMKGVEEKKRLRRGSKILRLFFINEYGLPLSQS